MKQVQLSFKEKFRLLTLMLCMAMAVPQLHAQMYIVGADPFGGWNPNGGVAMTNNNDGTYSYTTTANLNGEVHFVFASGQSSDWGTFNSSYRYGPINSNQQITANNWVSTQKSSNGNASYYINGANAIYDIFFDTNNSRFWFSQAYYVAGTPVDIFPDNWGYGANSKMTNNFDGTYSWTTTANFTAGGTYQFKVRNSNSSWYPANAGTSSGNIELSIDETNEYTLTVYFDGNNVTYSLNKKLTYSVIGASELFGGTSWSNAQAMTENSDGTWTWSASNVHFPAGSFGFKAIDDNNGYHPTGSNNDVKVNVSEAGYYNLVINYDPSSSDDTPTFDLTQVSADPVTYSVIGSSALFGGTDWNNAQTMTDNGDGTYSWTVTDLSLTAGDYVFKVKDSNNGYHPTGMGNDVSVNVSATGTYTLVITYDPSSVDDTPTFVLTRTDHDNYYLIGYANAQRWAANAGIEMTYVAETGYYVLENVVLTANSQFAFATQLGSTSTDWTGLDAHRLSSTGDNHWAITGEDWISYQNYVDDNHNWYVTQSGSYRVEIDPANHKVRVIPSHESMYISYGVNWTYANNSEQMTTVDGNTYQITVTLNNGDYFLFSTAKHDTTAWGATQPGFEITDLMLGQTQTLVKDSINNFHFTGTTGKYVVVVNKEKGTVIIRKTVDAKEKTLTKIYLQKTDNVTLDPAGGTYHSQVLEGKRGGIFAWNKLNLSNGGGYYTVCQDGPSNYTYDNEVENDYGGNGYLNDLQDTTTMDGKQWYAWSVSNSICEFYFIRNNKTDHKSQNVMRRAGEVWLTWTDLKATTNCQTDAVECDSLQDVTRNYYAVSASGVSDCATMLEGHYYVYYTNTTGWDSVYCYAWNETPLVEFTGTYPGSKCTFVGYDDNGYEVWCYDFGLMADVIAQYGRIPSNVIFNNGRGAASEGAEGDKYRQQTGDMPFNNGACYDYLGLIYLGNSLNAIINSGIVNGPKYTVEDDLMGVYYDDNAVTEILYTDENGQPIPDDNGEYQYIEVIGALYAKDFENYSAKSRQPDGTTDYVYEICAHRKTSTFPGGSQVQLKREYYDQSNWVKIVLSPNFDNANAKSNGDVTIEAEKFDKVNFSGAQSYNGGYLSQYVGKIIPGHSMSGNLANNVNPQMHITNIAKPEDAPAYEKNVYITPHFNDSVVFSYVHQDWSPGEYKGVYKTKPIMGYNDKGEQIVAETVVDSTKLYKMFYVAPKPQEVAYITWAVFHHDNPNGNIGVDCDTEPDDPGEFRVPMNWNRKGQLWDGSAINPADPDAADAQAAWGTTYGPFSNGYMQYGAFQVNWSLFEGMDIVDDHMTGRPQEPWYRIFKPGQAYKILAIIRYAYGDNLNDREYSAGVYKGNGYNEGNDPERPNHVSNAPRRSNDTWADIMYAPYDNLNKSKFIVFPLLGSSEDSNGSGIGNVTTVKEVVAERTVVNVSYYNLMGVHSDKPFDGLNIVVTTYSDGSRTSKKILR